MALLQGYSGKPVLVSKYSIVEKYEPHFRPGVSEIIPRFFQHIDPAIPIIKLVDIVMKARGKYAGREMVFLDFFPLYGAHEGKDGTLELHPGYRLEKFEPNIPIYFPVAPPS